MPVPTMIRVQQAASSINQPPHLPSSKSRWIWRTCFISLWSTLSVPSTWPVYGLTYTLLLSPDGRRNTASVLRLGSWLTAIELAVASGGSAVAAMLSSLS